MYSYINFADIIRDAWAGYDPSRKVRSVVDISAMVSTNHVFRVKFNDGGFVIAKCSFFGKFDHFKEDHTIINILGNNLPPPFENFLARSLTKGDEVYTFPYKQGIMDAWVVFYNPIRIDKRLPRQLEEHHIRRLGGELARFHLACRSVNPMLPHYSKTLRIDLNHLLEIIVTDDGQFIHRQHIDDIRRQCDIFFENCDRLGYSRFAKLPVFVDWNIGNFSVTPDTGFFFAVGLRLVPYQLPYDGLLLFQPRVLVGGRPDALQLPYRPAYGGSLYPVPERVPQSIPADGAGDPLSERSVPVLHFELRDQVRALLLPPGIRHASAEGSL